MVQWVGVQGQVKVAQTKQKHLHLLRSPRNTPTENEKVFFSISTKRLAESVEGLNEQFSRSIAWPVMAKECWCQAKFPTCYCFSVILLHRINK